MWQAMGDKTSTLATLAEDTYEFTRLLLRSDLMDTVLRGDEVAMRNLVLNDTIERREIYRQRLPGEVRRHITGAWHWPRSCRTTSTRPTT
jgi:hypothetical protein